MGYAIKIGGIGSLSENDRNKIITIYNRVVPNGTLLGYIRDDWLTSSLTIFYTISGSTNALLDNVLVLAILLPKQLHR